MHAQALLQRIKDEGHTIGSHTVDHISLDNLDTTRIEYELGGLESTLGDIGIPAPRVSLVNSELPTPCVQDRVTRTAQCDRQSPADGQPSWSFTLCKCARACESLCCADMLVV